MCQVAYGSDGRWRGYAKWLENNKGDRAIVDDPCWCDVPWKGASSTVTLPPCLLCMDCCIFLSTSLCNANCCLGYWLATHSHQSLTWANPLAACYPNHSLNCYHICPVNLHCCFAFKPLLGPMRHNITGATSFILLIPLAQPCLISHKHTGSLPLWGFFINYGFKIVTTFLEYTGVGNGQWHSNWPCAVYNPLLHCPLHHWVNPPKFPPELHHNTAKNPGTVEAILQNAIHCFHAITLPCLLVWITSMVHIVQCPLSVDWQTLLGHKTWPMTELWASRRPKSTQQSLKPCTDWCSTNTIPLYSLV